LDEIHLSEDIGEHRQSEWNITSTSHEAADADNTPSAMFILTHQRTTTIALQQQNTSNIEYGCCSYHLPQ
jgi:hypothetical protein